MLSFVAILIGKTINDFLSNSNKGQPKFTLDYQIEPSEHISKHKKQWGKLSSYNFTVVAVFPKTCIKQASFNG